MGIIIKNALIEAYHSIDIIKCYYRLLWQFYSIITITIFSIKANLTFQIFFKTINNLIDLNKLVTISIVFSTNLRMTK